MIDLLRTVARRRLTEAEAAEAMRVIMRGEATPAQIAGFALAVTVRGVSVDDLVGMAGAAQEFATRVRCEEELLDTCGTGGDGLNTFNISTAAAIVAAACGVRVAKHGNRSASSACGSADVLEELGVRIDLGADEAAACLETAGITFLFAPVFHPAFRHTSGPRRELGVRTVFNLLGPLCNPSGARLRTLGVPSRDLVEPMAEVLGRLGVTRALVFHSEDGMDELSTGAPAHVVEMRDGRRTTHRFDPADHGLPRSCPSDLTGGDRAVNAAVVRRVLAGEPGPARDVVLLNAAAALRVADRADTWSDGLRLAASAVDSGAAADRLERWTRASWKRAELEVPA
ncbi:anthranilate phosphoribosyltransferase [Streptomyces turgidiscabies]|uniref:Anthranilate phosphoribosyltransferase n=1 Tax=Streptomyces turgidiscabies TaxID=85558 RepID=A0ABU0RZV4_9ACTN|nr:anthranilate phosphoribosyltransferase [Streptomyces turgidiscabies]MDQ0937538.1 anthranilate phosphoribosyltransferase [Streptomyces turgidiscabies]